MLCCSIFSSAVGIWYSFRSSRVLAVLCITIGLAQQQPALLIHQPFDIVMFPLFALQIDQICEVPILHITILFFLMMLRQFSPRYT